MKAEKGDSEKGSSAGKVCAIPVPFPFHLYLWPRYSQLKLSS